MRDALVVVEDGHPQATVRLHRAVRPAVPVRHDRDRLASDTPAFHDGGVGTLARWVAVGLASAAMTVAMRALGLPSPALFAALLVGLVYALRAQVPLALARAPTVVRRRRWSVWRWARRSSCESLTGLGERWAGVRVVVLGTLGVSLVAGLVLASRTGLDRPTALLGLVAGGASGIVSMSDELGADARLVAFMQYARVLSSCSVRAARGRRSSSAARDGPARRGRARGAGWRRISPTPPAPARPASRSRGSCASRPAACSCRWSSPPCSAAAGWRATPRVPGLVQDVAFALVGLQVGLRFTPATVRLARRSPPRRPRVDRRRSSWPARRWPRCSSSMTGVTYADAYLATTPGGLYAVLATALDGGGEDPAFVLAVQALRLLVMVLAAPLLVRLLVPAPRRGAGPGRPSARASRRSGGGRAARPRPPTRCRGPGRRTSANGQSAATHARTAPRAPPRARCRARPARTQKETSASRARLLRRVDVDAAEEALSSGLITA